VVPTQRPNGGFGSVQLAIAHGVPTVVAGTSEDKKEVTAHVDWSGTGINLRTNRPSPRAIAEAVERVLNQPTFRDRTLALQASTAGGSPAVNAADLLEELASTSHGAPRPFGTFRVEWTERKSRGR
jgi:UDP:flavonoid glycosyltransferase YjiC (YdhE family)